MTMTKLSRFHDNLARYRHYTTVLRRHPISHIVVAGGLILLIVFFRDKTFALVAIWVKALEVACDVTIDRMFD